MRMAQLLQQVETFQSEAEKDFEELSTEIVDTHTTYIETSFSTFSEQVSQTQLAEITNQFSNFENNLTNLYSSFNSEVEGLGDKLKDRCSEIIQDMGNHCEDSLKDELETAFKDAIESVIEEMLEEIIENITLMAIGSSITGSISYILPELVVAKKTAELANAGLDVIGF